MDSLIQEKVSQKANELTATYDEKIRNYEDRSVSQSVFVRRLLIYIRSFPENKTYSASYRSQRTNYEIYVPPTKQIKPSSLITVKSRVRFTFNVISWPA